MRVVRNLGNEDPDIVVNCFDLEATCRLLVESRFLGLKPRVAWFADQNLTGFRSNTTLCWRDGDLRSFQRQFRAMHGTVASDTALRCATTAQNTATMEASNSRRSVKPDHTASLLSNLDVMTTCYGRLFLLRPDFIPLRNVYRPRSCRSKAPKKERSISLFHLNVTVQLDNARSTHHVRAFHQWSRRSRRISDTAATLLFAISGAVDCASWCLKEEATAQDVVDHKTRETFRSS